MNHTNQKDCLAELPHGRRLSLLRALAKAIHAVKRGHIHTARRELNEADGHLAMLEAMKAKECRDE